MIKSKSWSKFVLVQTILLNLFITRRCQDRLERALQSTQFAQSATEEQLERAHVRIEELKLINNKLNDQLIDEQQERHKFQNNSISIDHQRETLRVSIILYIVLVYTRKLNLCYINRQSMIHTILITLMSIVLFFCYLIIILNLRMNWRKNQNVFAT